MSAAIAVAALLAISARGASAADKLGTADRRAIETVIRQQIDAFGRDDADRAFGYASAEIQRRFGTAERFLDMVREHYEAVYRAAALRFGPVVLVDGDWIQSVDITDEDGKVWRALFTMRRQPDRGWKVGGCRLAETSALET